MFKLIMGGLLLLCTAANYFDPGVDSATSMSLYAGIILISFGLDDIISKKK